ncbi:MAG: hypothetical protein WCF84_24825 [Anaerolineae bacterium]
MHSVRQIRLQHQWYHPLDQSRQATELSGYLTARGLAQRLGVDRSWVYRRLEQGEIDGRYVKRDPESSIYLITNDEQLIERLRQAVQRKPLSHGGI